MISSSSYTCNSSLLELLENLAYCSNGSEVSGSPHGLETDDVDHNAKANSAFYAASDYPANEPENLKALRNQGYSLVATLADAVKAHADNEHTHQWEKFIEQLDQVLQGQIRADQVAQTPDDIVTWGADGPYFEQINTLLDIVNTPSMPFHMTVPVIRKAVEDAPPISAAFAHHKTAKNTSTTSAKSKAINDIAARLIAKQNKARLDRLTKEGDENVISTPEKNGAKNDFVPKELDKVIKKLEAFLTQTDEIDSNYGKTKAQSNLTKLALMAKTKLEEIKEGAMAVKNHDIHQKTEVENMLAMGKA